MTTTGADGLAATLWLGGVGRPVSWRDVGRLPWDRFDLVCGAGGATGAAFAAGALMALDHDHGVDLSGAGHVVGTSSGAIVAGLVGMGLRGHDLGAVVGRLPSLLPDRFAAFGAAFDPDLPPPPALRRWVRWGDVGAMRRAARAVRDRAYRAAVLSCLRPGEFDVAERLAFLGVGGWAQLGSRVTVSTVALHSGRRVLFDGSAAVPLETAVAASCALPPVIRPVEIDGVAHVDGGIHSPTNADVVLDDPTERLTCVVAPMSGVGAASVMGRVTSRWAARRLGDEIGRAPHRPVLVLEPRAALARLVIDDAASDVDHLAIMRAAFLSAAACGS